MILRKQGDQKIGARVRVGLGIKTRGGVDPLQRANMVVGRGPAVLNWYDMVPLWDVL